MTEKPIQIAYYEKSEKQQENTLNYRRRKIHTGDNELLKSMMYIAEKSLNNHIADFYIHDVELVKNYKDDAFLWVVRDYGTHYINLHVDCFTDDNEWDSLYYFNCVLQNAESSLSKIKGIYYCQNDTLKKVNKVKATLILQQYENLIRNSIVKAN